ncbi:MAG: type I-E CRISPR-associated protein Cas7/Cse4/CasC, partial [Chloroflexi bacterium]|nr:type I-E CRISPR-associated protein Cas7/Cse4/CasC [Chloroflexota bacterium]
MFVELHIVQQFAPSNLNRDDTGAPKDCEFGGYRRARISSQCLKRAMRRDPGFARFLESCGGSYRTRRLIIEIAERMSGRTPAPAAVSKVVSEAFKEGGVERPTKEQGKEEHDHTKPILFRDALQGGDTGARSAAVTELGKLLVDSAKVPDVALFGRMIEVGGSTPFGKLNLRVNAASQVAHAISTHKVSVEFDFYTAVDDLLPSEETGAGMMGTVEFNSACFYRYANVDLAELARNLGGDEELARATLEAYLRAAVSAVPTGKQNSMAAQNPPSFVFAVAREAGLWSLANAFAKPVWVGQSGDLVQQS